MKLSAACAFVVGTVAVDIGSAIRPAQMGEEEPSVIVHHYEIIAACAFVVGPVALDIGSASFSNYGSTIDTAVLSAVEKSTKKPKNNGLHAKPATSSSSAMGILDGSVCSIKLKARRTYTLRATLGNETVLFLERPNRGAATISIQAFVNNFDKAFASSSPNVAITFTGDTEPSSSSSSSASLDRPFVAFVSRPGGLNGGNSTLDVEYLMEQSESQSTVATIEQFLDASGSCSLFIDALTVVNIIVD